MSNTRPELNVAVVMRREFFTTHIQPWAMTMCDTLQQHPKARFYAAVAELTRAFMSAEAQRFDRLET
jgi:TorA maturation chaperone TorD